MTTLTIGIDVSLKTLDVAVALDSQRATSLGRFANEAAGYKELAAKVEQVAQGATIHLIMEPTGGYELPLAQFARERSWLVSLPNPRKVKEWASSQGRRAKTDKQDAQKLACYGAAHDLPLWRPLPPAVAELEALLARRTDLEGMLQQERNRQQVLQAQGTYQGPVAASLDQSIAWLEQAIATVNAAIQQHIDHHPDLQDQIKRLQTVPGIGRRNVLPILVLLHRWGTLTDYQGSTRGLTAFVGLDPQPFQSGSSIRKPSTISRQGDPALRSLLYFSALGGTRGNNPLRHFYQRLVAASKPKKLALIAAARKMLSWAWVVFRDHTVFDPARTGFSTPAS